MQIKIKSITHESKVSKKTGNSFESCRIVSFSEKKNKDISLIGFGSNKTKTWSAGDIVDVDIETDEKGYCNFKENDNTEFSKTIIERLKDIEAKLDRLIGPVVEEKNDEVMISGIKF